MKYLDQTLYEYSHTDFYPFHMPGHKRQMEAGYLENPYAVDITEITDFDNLHHAEGILRDNQELAARLYGAEKTYFLVNGSTAGLLSAISACTSRNGAILMARNCHKAAYHAAYLRGVKTFYLYPSYEETCGLNGGISPEDVEKMLKKEKSIEAVLLTSPSYDGVVSDIKNIAEIAHSHGVPLIVDEAHGAHFHFHEYFPVSALDLGADVVIQSLHKTLPSLTQSAMLHIGKNKDICKKINRNLAEQIERFLGIYQTSSPSYILMAGIVSCLRYLQENGEKKFEDFANNLEICREQLKKLKVLRLIGEELKQENSVFDFDKSKIIISTAWASIDGPELHRRLREKYHLEMEMEAEQYILALTSVMDTKEGFRRLVQALREIDEELAAKREESSKIADTEKVFDGYYFVDSTKISKAEQVFTIAEGMEKETEEAALYESEGKISAEYAYLYPPGIPLLVPGERISREFLCMEQKWKAQGIYLQGLGDYRQEKIRVIREW